MCREFAGCALVMGTSAVFHIKEIMEGRCLLCHGVCGSQHFKYHIAVRMLVDTHSMTQHHILQKVNLQQHHCENLKFCSFVWPLWCSNQNVAFSLCLAHAQQMPIHLTMLIMHIWTALWWISGPKRLPDSLWGYAGFPARWTQLG